MYLTTSLNYEWSRVVLVLAHTQDRCIEYSCVFLQFLIGFKQGLIVLWDIEENNVLQTYTATQV